MRPKNEAPRCRATTAGYMVEGEHRDTCDVPGCRGCLPCEPRDDQGRPLQHCAARARCSEHVEPGATTCPRCLGKTRRQLARIADLTALLPAAAVESGRLDSEAVNLAGPSADPAGWVTANTQAALAGLPTEDDPDGPYLVLGRWDLALREDYGPPTRLRITVSRTADYLCGQLDRLAQDPEQDFPLFVREVAACLDHLEAVLAVALRRETGAPCPACRDAGEEKPARLVLHRDDSDLSGARDSWACPECRTRWTDAEYRLRIGADYLDHATALTASQLRQAYRVSESTVRTWAQRGKVRKRGRDVAGRLLYDVDDVISTRDGEVDLDSASES